MVAGVIINAKASAYTFRMVEDAEPTHLLVAARPQNHGSFTPLLFVPR